MTFFTNILDAGYYGLPASVTAVMLDIGKKDKISRTLINDINKEEAQLLNQIKFLAKQNPDFDEEPYNKIIQCFSQKRQLLAQMIEEQVKSVQAVYDHIDKKITYFDSCAKRSEISLQNFAESGEFQSNKKRKKNKSDSDTDFAPEPTFDELINAAVVDPSEPLYCHCKRISFGQMVACENPDCPIEWYHFSCVGLKEEPPDLWFCPTCRSKMDNQAS